MLDAKKEGVVLAHMSCLAQESSQGWAVYTGALAQKERQDAAPQRQSRACQAHAHQC